MTIDSSASGQGSEYLLHQAAMDLDPARGAQARVKRLVRSQLRAPALLDQVRHTLTPAPALVAHLWTRILTSIDPLRSLSLWEQVREILEPAEEFRAFLWSRFAPRLQPHYAHAAVSRPVKWVAAFAVVLFAVRVSPLLFLAPASIAESPVTLFSPQGDTEVLMGALWQQPLRDRRELSLHTPTQLQTQTGEATLVVHDDVVFRFAPGTRAEFRDLTDRPEPSAQETTIALVEGGLWVLGLVPKQVRAVSVLTAQGRILIHEGSVAIVQHNGEVTVRVFDRSAIVSRHGKKTALVAGDQITLAKDGKIVSTKMDLAQFQEPWVAANLGRDAAHQREIAQLQQERRAASAGILPGSRLYPVKRLAESVNVLFSLNEEERARKLITQANTRLNEAAALLGSGGTEQAEGILQEYKDTLLQVASGSGGSSVVRSLLQKEVVEAGSAAVAAALPGDSAYALKQTIDETIEALPAGVDKPNMAGEVLLDQLAAVKRQAAEGDTDIAKEKLAELADSIASLDATGALTLVSPGVREEAKAVAQRVAIVVEGPVQGISLTLGAPPKEIIIPQHARIQPMTPEQVAAKVQEIRGRIFVYGTKKAQYDALSDQIGLLIRNPDRGRILRELSRVLPQNGLAQRVLREIRTVSEEVQMQVTASGGTAAAQ